ncbi:tetratricopeptide repeat (TPR)-like superfamily protein [Actinidia rufa]|uniref:Tetratricopeptide repeat (TPR)-like superfamily protein n=1 Tax=Actinidia rufa TaxID=165716 RepID=A0A7J0H7C8_9ERIC|nr:tetratricopeptide repeat (TPR)-like superfamily protein [Actinidia rufa]
MRLFPWPKGLKRTLFTCKDRESVSKIHAFMIVSGLFSNKTCNGQLVATVSQAEVVDLYHEMILERVRPDSSTFTVALKACASLSDLETGEEIWHGAVECGYECDVFVGSSFLNLYAKCGKMEEALSVFNKMPRRDLVSWTTMVTGFAQSGHAHEAINFYRMMRGEKMEGDGVVMLGLIQACANLGDTKMGLSIHGYMIRREIRMDVVVQTSLVDMRCA